MVSASPNRSRFGLRILVALALTACILTPHASLPTWAATGTFSQHTYSGPAGSRDYFVYTPAGYTTGARVPLVVMLHGCNQTATDFANTTQMNALADSNQFIVVYPQQSAFVSVDLCWQYYLPANQARDGGEPAIIAGITQAVISNTASWNIDATRVYATGLSAGAALAVILGATYPDTYAAIGEESGLEYGVASDSSSNANARLVGGPDPTTQGQAAYAAMGPRARVVPVIVFHGTSDGLVSPINGDQVVQQWMETDRLASSNTYNASFASPSSMTIDHTAGLQGHPYTVRRWNNTAGVEVQEYWSIIGMGHAWSGGSYAGTFADPNGPSASQMMYSFFLAHPH